MAKRKRYDLDIVIPVFGRLDLLERCLESIEATKGDLKTNIILVDDCGPESLNGEYSQCKVINHKENMGFARTCNDGIKVGHAPLVLLLNSDIILQENCLQFLVDEFSKSEVGVVAPKLLFPEDSTDPHRPAGKIQHAGLSVDIQGNILHSNISWPADHRLVNQRRSLQAVTGACLMIRRSILKKVYQAYRTRGDNTTGPLNEIYGKGTYEDVELCFAARALDYDVAYIPEAVAYHYVGASVLQENGAYPLQRNALIFRARCGELLIWDEWKYL